jgi:hypothetical protein
MLAVVLPRLFVKVTDPGMTAFTSPWMVNGCVKLNWLPNAVEAESWNHWANIDCTGTVTSLDCSVLPAAAVKWKTAWVTSRAVE